jgi:protocatechuate 3,4-dioxygenase beta subunit
MRCRFAIATTILTLFACCTIVEGQIAAADRAAKTPDRSAKLKVAPSVEVSGDVVKVRGTVLGPDGGPLAGARISVLHSAFVNAVGTWRQIATATTRLDGAFELVYRRSQYGTKVNEVDQRGEIKFLVEADSYAFAVTYFMEIDAAKPLVFKLVRDFPIRGRVLDLQGQPIAGTSVTVAEIYEGNQGSLGSWLEQVRTGKSRWIIGRQKPGPVRMRFKSPPRNRDDAWAVTDREGRFEIRGIAAECHATLALRGESVAFQRLEVVTRQMPTLKGQQDGATNPVDPVYGADFTCVASPGRPIEGTVRDAASGKPLAGVRVQVWRFAQPGIGRQWDLVALTDEKGHYRLAGLSFGTGNRLLLSPSDEHPYLVRTVGVPDWRESGPKTFDVELHRGLWITGRATDKVTGKPVVAQFYYLPFLENPFANRLPEFLDGNGAGQQDRYRTHPDGSFRLVGLPGRAIVGARATGGVRYRAGVGASAIAGMDKEGRFPTFRNSIQASRLSLDVLKEINPREGVDEVKCDLILDPGQTIHVALVDQRGKPVERAMIQGVAAVDPARPKPAKFDLIGFAAGDKRPVMIYHEKLRIGKFFLFEYTDRTPQSMTVTLEPCAVIRGRVVDRDGIGVKAGVSGSPRPGGDFWPRTEPVDTQSDGKFECVVPPGCRYALSAVTRVDRTWVDDISVEAGKTTDVGDVKIELMK